MDVDGLRKMLFALAGWRARSYVSLRGRIARPRKLGMCHRLHCVCHPDQAEVER